MKYGPHQHHSGLNMGNICVATNAVLIQKRGRTAAHGRPMKTESKKRRMAAWFKRIIDRKPKAILLKLPQIPMNLPRERDMFR